jgi:serine/threonine protein kinase
MKTPADSHDLIAGRYRLGAWLGRGGMGEVRAGIDLRLDRDVAVKLLRADLAHQLDLRQRFEREARAAARISHPNVVAVFDTGEHAGVPFIVMERLPGTTLATDIADGPLTPPEACTVVLEVLSALEAAHQLGVVHRDIKPGNILRARDGHVKVADFGIAKIAEDTDAQTTGVLLGTAAYLAPERLAGEPATAASDLYSVGVVLFETLAGRVPFEAETPLALMAAISSGSPLTMSAVRPEVPHAVVSVIERAMMRDPARRFDSAAAMAAALRVATAGELPTEDRPTVPIATARADTHDSLVAPSAPTEIAPSPLPRVTSSSRRRMLGRRATAWLVGVAVLLVVAALLLVVVDAGGDAPPAPGPTASVPTTTQPAIPAPLKRAIDQLNDAVRP